MLFGLKKENRCTEGSRVKIYLSCKSSLPRERFQGSHLPFLSQACFQMPFTIDPAPVLPGFQNIFPFYRQVGSIQFGYSLLYGDVCPKATERGYDGTYIRMGTTGGKVNLKNWNGKTISIY